MKILGLKIFRHFIFIMCFCLNVRSQYFLVGIDITIFFDFIHLVNYAKPHHIKTFILCSKLFSLFSTFYGNSLPLESSFVKNPLKHFENIKSKVSKTCSFRIGFIWKILTFNCALLCEEPNLKQFYRIKPAAVQWRYYSVKTKESIQVDFIPFKVNICFISLVVA